MFIALSLCIFHSSKWLSTWDMDMKERPEQHFHSLNLTAAIWVSLSGRNALSWGFRGWNLLVMPIISFHAWVWNTHRLSSGKSKIFPSPSEGMSSSRSDVFGAWSPVVAVMATGGVRGACSRQGPVPLTLRWQIHGNVVDGAAAPCGSIALAAGVPPPFEEQQNPSHQPQGPFLALALLVVNSLTQEEKTEDIWSCG